MGSINASQRISAPEIVNGLKGFCRSLCHSQLASANLFALTDMRPSHKHYHLSRCAGANRIEWTTKSYCIGPTTCTHALFPGVRRAKVCSVFAYAWVCVYVCLRAATAESYCHVFFCWCGGLLGCCTTSVRRTIRRVEMAFHYDMRVESACCQFVCLHHTE